jgi:hypothetical protein
MKATVQFDIDTDLRADELSRVVDHQFCHDGRWIGRVCGPVRVSIDPGDDRSGVEGVPATQDLSDPSGGNVEQWEAFKRGFLADAGVSRIVAVEGADMGDGKVSEGMPNHRIAASVDKYGRVWLDGLSEERMRIIPTQRKEGT